MKNTKFNEQNTISSGAVLGDYESTGGSIGNKDSYAEGDARVASIFAGASGKPVIQTRFGPKSGKKKSKKTKNEGFNSLYEDIIKKLTN